MMASRILLITLISVGGFIYAASECNHDCCRQGGTCGDPVYDECDGNWDYRTKCSPTYRVCCLPREPVTTTTTTTTKPPPTTEYTGPTTKPPPTTTTEAPPPLPNDCGRRPAWAETGEKIVGGVEAKPHSWPWAVSIEMDYFGWGGWEHHCGGSVINNRWILTAAHCIAKSGVSDQPNLFRVLLGLHNQNQQTGVKTVSVEKMIWHEDYSTTTAGSPNDICLLKLSEDIVFNEKVSPVCLPQIFYQNFTVINDCYILGWGLTQGTGNEDVLNESKIDVITNELCDQKWEEGSGRVNLIKENHICAGNGVPGTCNGDSGGPLVCRIGDQWVQAGATSFGASGCTAENAPDVYTRLSMFKKWIEQTIDNNY